MSKRSKAVHKPTVIEIDDSTDDESTNTSDSRSIMVNNPQERKAGAMTTSSDITEDAKTQDEPPSTSTSVSESKNKLNDSESTIPKRVLSRRKSMHHSIRSTADMTFECSTISRKRRESSDDITNKKTRWNETQIDDAVDSNLNNPEIEEMLKKIAYCRVFTNYLLRQYDMLAIDFKLYSNLDMLNLDLKMRVDTYSAIRKSRQRFKEARDLNKDQIQL